MLHKSVFVGKRILMLYTTLTTPNLTISLSKRASQSVQSVTFTAVLNMHDLY